MNLLQDYLKNMEKQSNIIRYQLAKITEELQELSEHWEEGSCDERTDDDEINFTNYRGK